MKPKKAKTLIVLRYVNNAATSGTTYKFKTLRGARNRAHTLVGAHPRQDPDGYAVARTGECLFIISGTTFDGLFTAEEQPA